MAETTDQLLLAYLAGAMDGDGHVTVLRTIRTKGKQYAHRPTYFLPKMGYTSTSALVPNLFRETLGGAVHTWQPKNDRHKRVYLWHVNTAECGDVARLLIPHLRQKKRQAELVVELCGIITAQHREQISTQKPPYRITPEQLAIREEYWIAVSELNAPTNRRVHFPTARPVAGGSAQEINAPKDLMVA